MLHSKHRMKSIHIVYLIDKILIRISRKLRRFYFGHIYPVIVNSHIVQCPVCKWHGEYFLDYNCGLGNIYKNAECPKCFPHPRHRLIYLLLRRILHNQSVSKRIHVLHIAPEKSIELALKSVKNIQYLSIDLDPRRAMQVENLEKLTLPSNTYDIILCLCVLEHVADDSSAVKELRRVLHKHGLCIIDTPVDTSRDSTLEDPTVVSPTDRTLMFGQDDHVRKYGRDFPQRLQKLGFKVEKFTSEKIVPNSKVSHFGLPDYPIYVCTKK